MQFPESWLREFCNPPISSQELADTLTMAGLEVEEQRPVAPPCTQVIVGQILATQQHPNADRLRVCTVDVGQAEPLQIVCGAPNARGGIKVPCALVGATLPSGEDGKSFKIKIGKLRGVESHGMLCSARELQLSDDHGGLLELDSNAPVGADIREALNLDDTVFTLKLTPNLGHALSVYGVARELAAVTGTPLVTPQHASVSATIEDRVPVTIDADDLCGRFSGRVVRHIDPSAKTPAWMVDRLARCGQRSVSPLVDISNYVMFEYGRPTHIFDLDKIHGGLRVRWGCRGETLKLLNGNTVELDESVGVIADDRKVESLAGIMGGDATAVSDDTRHIYVEAAFWWPDAIAGRSRHFNFATDAGHRFERGVDPALTVEHIERISQLIMDICGTVATAYGPIDDQQPHMPQLTPVTLRVSRAARVIGMPISQAQCADVFRRLGLPYTEGKGTLTVTPPTYRFDLQIEADLIEEVARIVGYQQLPETAPIAPMVPRVRSETRRDRFEFCRSLAALGYLETINFSFVEPAWERDLAGNTDPIRLLNPIASPMSVMRSTLIGSLLQVVKRNIDRRASRVRVFEMGRVFMRDPSVAASLNQVEGVAQPMRIAAVAYGSVRQQGWEGKQASVDFFDIKGDVEALLGQRDAVFEPVDHPALHPGRAARILLEGQIVGVVGELHPKWRQQWEFPLAPVVFELDLNAVLMCALPQASTVSRYQPVERDIAVVVKQNVTHRELMTAVRSAATNGLLRDATLFDIYRPKSGSEASSGMQTDEKSLAVRLELLSDAETLIDERIDSVVQSVLARLQADVGARLRG